MKTNLKILVVLVTILSISFYQCKKDDQTKLTPNLKSEDLNSYYLEGDQAMSKIEILKKELNAKTSIGRDGASISVAEAVWNIEATVNATYGHANFSRKMLKQFSGTINLNTVVENNEKTITTAEQMLRYNQIIDSINTKAVGTGYPANKRSLIYADINAVTDSIGDLKLEYNIGIGLDPKDCPTCPVDFELANIPNCDDTNCWYYGQKNGTCNTPNTGFGFKELDATDVLEGWINGIANGNYLCLSTIGTNPDGFFINPTLSNLLNPMNLQNQSFLQIQNPHSTSRDFYKYRLFRTSFTPNWRCIPPNDMQWLRSQGEYIIVNKLGISALPGQVFMDCDYSWNLLGSTALHTMQYRYGTFVPR